MIQGLKDSEVGQIAPIAKTYEIGGKKITLEWGKLAMLTDGSVTVRDECGNYLLTTAGISKNVNPNAGWFPLSVDYQEKFYSTGKIGGGRINKREAKPTTYAVLTSRLIDRPIRPMFPKGVLNEVQIVPTILSACGKKDFGVWGVTGASLALQIAGVHEFEGPISGARIIMDQSGELHFNPNFEEVEAARFELVIAGTADMITMVELLGDQAQEEDILKAFEYGQAILKSIGEAQLDFLATIKSKHTLTEVTLTKKEGISGLEEATLSHLDESITAPLFGLGKIEFHEKFEEIVEATKEKMGYTEDTEEMNGSAIHDFVYGYVKKVMRKRVLETGERLDGRKTNEVRPVDCIIGELPRAHGSVLFRRGFTSALSVVTLGGPMDKELVDGMFPAEERRYMHHYNFPPYSVGEVRYMRGPSRRDIGHGNLGEKALVPVLPTEEEFGYTIRVVSEITTCNGSSSMASVCGSSMALMDAGVPIKAPVAGVAMGMIFDEESGEYKILSDIQAQEDFLGDLDFKVAGTDKGITALQMDTKISGLSLEIVAKVFSQAKEARSYIMESMTTSLNKPRSEVSENAPALISFAIDGEKIGDVIGKGGETIQGIQKDYEVTIAIEEKDDKTGLVVITGDSRENGLKAQAQIMSIIKEIEVGEELGGKVVKIIDGVGAIVEFAPGKSGMIHISKLSKERVEKVQDVVKEGEEVQVKVLTVDKAKGRIGLQKIG